MTWYRSSYRPSSSTSLSTAEPLVEQRVSIARPAVEKRVSIAKPLVEQRVSTSVSGVAKATAPASLSPDQAAALVGLVAGDDSLLTGEAGSGKSHVIGAFRAQVPSTVCGTTGLAAMQVGGMTVDRLFGFSRSNWRVRNEANTERNMLSAAPTIIIDEASMMGASMSRVIRSVAQRYKKRLILVGDFAQAGPVKDDWATGTALLKDIQVHRLTSNHRQGNGQAALLGALRSLRLGVVDQAVRDVFKECQVNAPPQDDGYVRLFGTNRLTESYNHQRLDALCPMAQQRVLVTSYASEGRKKATHEEAEQRCGESGLAHNERFAIGARVVITGNDKEGDRFVNGDTGTILRFQGNTRVTGLTIRRDRDRSEIDLEPIERMILSGSGKPVGTVSGYPLKLGWALTIHRAQGMTLDKVFVDLGSICQFPDDARHGLAYVALSRSRTLAGLKVANWRDEAVFCHPAVKSFL